jgi:hypothetical protein
MSSDRPIDTFVLQEFRLHTADVSGEAARIVATFAGGTEPAVPLLTSIDDSRDVATVRRVRAGQKLEVDPRERTALGALVATWRPLKRYGPRITERSERAPTYYRLAVTESGINETTSGQAAGVPRTSDHPGSTTRLGLLWIGLPLETHAGLMTLVGGDDDARTTRPDPRVWPLPFSRSLGVRIYESRR